MSYNCVPCKQSFTNWNNFKRHNREKHEVMGRFKCPYCRFQTNRGETRSRHVQKKHRSVKIVSAILDELLDEILSNEPLNVVSSVLDNVLCAVDEEVHDSLQEVDMNESRPSSDIASSDSESEEEMSYRDAQVAYIRAEFRRLYPSFDDEVRALREAPSKRKKKAKKQNPLPVMPCRSSSRLKNKVATKSGLEDYFGGDDDRHEEVDSVASMEEATYSNHEDGNHGETNIAQDDSGVDTICSIQQESVPIPDVSYETNEVDKAGLGKYACLTCSRSFR